MAVTNNMGLNLPVVDQTPGPLYASENNQAFVVIDGHNHIPGSGVPVPTAGLNINGDLAFNSFNASLVRSTQYVNQSSPLTLPTDVNSAYFSGGNFYINNNLGQPVQITAGAALNAASIGGIGGDYTTSGASVFYTSADLTYTFWSAPNTPGAIDAGPLTIRNLTLNSFGTTINSNATLSGNLNLTLFAALPASTKILTIDAGGNIADVYDVDNSTLVITSNTIMVGPAGITNTQMAPNSVSTSNLISQSVTQDKLAPRATGSTVAAGGFAISASSGSYTTSASAYTAVTNLSVTITTTGRPVFIGLISQLGGDNKSVVQIANPGGSFTGSSANIAFLSGASIISSRNIEMVLAATTTPPTDLLGIPPEGFSTYDFPVAGTYTYSVEVQMVQTLGLSSIVMFNTQLVAYEL